MKNMVCLLGVITLLTSSSVRADDKTPGLYRERYRPQYHFTADKGWINDPNGLVYVNGVYHLFFQHERPGTRWGHATSMDLLHWTQHPDAIVPQNGYQVFSGSGVVDENNTSGFQTGDSPPVVAIFTSWGEGQCLAYSNDSGMTWKRYEKNPVLTLPGDELKSFPLSARDPHVSWDKTHRRWVMALYSNPDQREDKTGSGFSLFTSPDLKTWTYRSHLTGFYVCPDIFKLPIEGEAGSEAWVAMDWEQYATGEFDGTTFTPMSDIRKLDFGKNLSANQSWKNLPGKRVVQICWLRGGDYPGMPFDQQMSFPTELTLRRITGELRLCKNPIREIETLHLEQRSVSDRTLARGEEIRFDLPVESYDLSMDLELADDSSVMVTILGKKLRLKRDRIVALSTTGELAEPLSHVRILADVTSIELFANQGEISMSYCVVPPDKPENVTIKATGNPVSIQSAVLHEVGPVMK